MAAQRRGATAHERAGGGATTDALSFFAARLSRRRYGDEELRVLEAALSASGDVAAMLETRSEARRMLRDRSTEAFGAAAAGEVGTRLSVADFFARAFTLAGDVESCLATRYDALLLREAKYSDDPHLHVSHEEWLTFAQDSLDNGFYTIASKVFDDCVLLIVVLFVLLTLDTISSVLFTTVLHLACQFDQLFQAFANALVHNHASPSDSSNPALKKNKIDDIRGLQNLAKSLSAQRSVQAQSAEYMKRKASGVSEKCNLHSEKPNTGKLDV